MAREYKVHALPAVYDRKTLCGIQWGIVSVTDRDRKVTCKRCLKLMAK